MLLPLIVAQAQNRIWVKQNAYCNLLQCCSSTHKQHICYSVYIYFVVLGFFPIDWCFEGDTDVPINISVYLIALVCKNEMGLLLI